MNNRSFKRKSRVIIGNIIADIRGLYVGVNRYPVFVFGNAKSGTSIIAFLLSEALQKNYTADIMRAIHDASLAIQLEHKLLSIDDIVQKYKLEFSRSVIKEPVLTNYASDILNYFTDARSVFVIRDPRDNIRSILNRLGIPGNLDSIVLDDWPELTKTRAWRLALDDSWKRKRHKGNYIEVMARNWMYSYEQYIINSSHASLVKYESFCKDKSHTIYHLCESIGLEVKKDISPIVNIQIQSKGDSGCDLMEFFGENNLSIIEKTCEEGILYMGYEKSIFSQNTSIYSHGI